MEIPKAFHCSSLISKYKYIQKTSKLSDIFRQNILTNSIYGEVWCEGAKSNAYTQYRNKNILKLIFKPKISQRTLDKILGQARTSWDSKY